MKKTGILYRLILIFFLPLHVFAQTPKLDSLNTLLNTAKADTQKVNILSALSYNYLITGDYESCRKKALETKTLGEQLNFKKGIGYAYNYLGILASFEGNYEEALKNYEQALKIREAMGDKINVAATLNNIGNAYCDQGKYEKAFEYQWK